MSMSLRDQLLKAGLVNEKQAKQAVKQKQKQNRMEHRGQAEKDRSQELAVQQAIVRYEGRYEVVPRATAGRTQERDPARVVLLNAPRGEPDPDDPYAAYQVPDDLMW